MKGIPLLSTGLDDNPVSEVWTDAAFLEACCAIELSWVQAAATEGLAEPDVVEELQAAIERVLAEPKTLSETTNAVGRPIAPLVDALAKDASVPLQKVLHLGLTTQDIIDGAFVLLRDKAQKVLDQNLSGLIASLFVLSAAHQETAMLARTNDQIAGATTFGLFLTEAAAELTRAQMRMKERHKKTRHIQLGGAVGLSMPFDNHTHKVRKHAGDSLSLKYDPSQSAASRDQIADYHLSLVLLSDVLARLSETIAALQSGAIGELAEQDPGKSSSIPGKQNPRLAERVLVIGDEINSLVPMILAATKTRHHRSGLSWQNEWAATQRLTVLSADQLGVAAQMIDRLVVNKSHMLAELIAAGPHAFAEQALVRLSKKVGRHEALETLKKSDLYETKRDIANLLEPQSQSLAVDPSSANLRATLSKAVFCAKTKQSEIKLKIGFDEFDGRSRQN